MPSSPPPPPPNSLLPHSAIEYTISKDDTAGHAKGAESDFSRLARADADVSHLANGETYNAGSKAPHRPLIGDFPFSQLLRAESGSTDEDSGSSQRKTSQHRRKRRKTAAGDGLTVQSPAAHYWVLHRVICSTLTGKYTGRLYEDEPRHKTLGRQHRHLRGQHRVIDLEAVLEEGNGPMFFAVYKNRHCRPESNDLYPTDSINLWNIGKLTARTSIRAVSVNLREKLERVSQFAPCISAYQIAPPFPAPLLSQSSQEYSYYWFYHHREALLEVSKQEGNDDIKSLLKYIEENPDHMFEKCDHLFKQGLVTSESLPWLFRPNEVILASTGHLETAYVLSQVPSGSLDFQLSCWNWEYDGKMLRRKLKLISLRVPYDDPTPIYTLKAYPLRLAPEEKRRSLLENGRSFWRYKTQTQVSYEGPDYMGERIYPQESRFMIDYVTYNKFHETLRDSAPPKAPPPVVRYDPWPRHIPREAEMEPETLMLLPPGIRAFFFKDKKWVLLHVNRVRPVQWNKVAFDRLVLPEQRKKLIKGLVLVRTPSFGEEFGNMKRRDDVINGKGGGLIMLLHGGPGTGKTLTAGHVAELAEMPLYNVTCGDIGTKPEAVERYLNSVLHLGKLWNCVFLRTLEYYDGILILTSNRVGRFDEAFKSRIQVALHYPPLNAASRAKIWTNFIDMLDEDDEDANTDDIRRQVKRLARHDLNGRQIRNAVTTARQLAIYERDTLEMTHIEQALDTANDFNKYLQELHGHSEEDWAKESNLR